MKIISALLLTLGISFQSAAAQVKKFRSTTGVDISVRYDLETVNTSNNKPSSSTYAANLEFEVEGNDVGPNEAIRVVLVNYEESQGQCGNPSEKREPNFFIDLKYDPSRRLYVGAFKTAKILLNGGEIPLAPEHQRLRVGYNGYCEKTYIRQELAVVINGQWQKDPLNHTSNFRFNLLF